MIALPNEQLQIQTRIAWIINATEFFIETLHGSNPADIDTGIKTALATYSAGSSAANAIFQGFDAARKQIIYRRESSLFANRKHTETSA